MCAETTTALESNQSDQGDSEGKPHRTVKARGLTLRCTPQGPSRSVYIYPLCVCVCVCVWCVCVCVCAFFGALRKGRAGQYIYILSLSLSLYIYIYISSLVHSARAEEKSGVFYISYIAGSSKQLQESSELVA
jgi:hypothetical protein